MCFNQTFSSEVDKRILGGEIRPDAIFHCYNINDVQQEYFIGVNYISSEDIYTVSFAKNIENFLFYGAEALVELKEDGNFKYSIYESDSNFKGIILTKIGSKRLRAIKEHWVSIQIVAIKSVEEIDIPEKSKKVFTSKTIKRLLTDISDIKNNSSELISPTNKNPKKHLEKLKEKHLLLKKIYDKIVEITNEEVEGVSGASFYRNFERCTEVGNKNNENYFYN